MRPDDPVLTPKERVAAGAALFFLVFAFLGIGYMWNFFSGKEETKPATGIEETSLEIHAALDRAMSEISNQVNRTLRPSDFR